MNKRIHKKLQINIAIKIIIMMFKKYVSFMMYKILLTILVIAIYEEISFLELKVIKSYLISIMSQQD